jgi:hypothetical protein
MIGAALLNVDTYEEVEHDQNATMQAAAVVAIVAACQAIGALDGGLLVAAWMAVTELGSWVLWAGITYLIGERIFQGEATWGELLRTLGFAKAPGVLYLLGVVPLLGTPVGAVVGIWMLVTAFVAVRQALDIGNGKTFLTVLVGGGVYAVLQLFLPF